VAAEMVPLPAHESSAATGPERVTGPGRPPRWSGAVDGGEDELAALDVYHATKADELRRGLAAAEGDVFLAAGEQTRRVRSASRRGASGTRPRHPLD